eukprot:gene10302-12641_t
MGDSNFISIDVVEQYQYTLPYCLYTGCEVTSVSMLLSSLGNNHDKNNNDNCNSPPPQSTTGEFSKEFLADLIEKEPDPIGSENNDDNNNIIYKGGSPWRSFVGSPYSKDSFGAFHQPIEKLLNQVLHSHSNNNCYSEYKVINLTDITNQQLHQQFPLLLNEPKEIPIVIWMTLELKQPKITNTWYDIKIPTNQIHWVSPEHCALLSGFDEKHYMIHDPHTGKKEYYPKSLFLTRWRQLGRQAVTIQPISNNIPCL